MLHRDGGRGGLCSRSGQPDCDCSRPFGSTDVLKQPNQCSKQSTMNPPPQKKRGSGDAPISDTPVTSGSSHTADPLDQHVGSAVRARWVRGSLFSSCPLAPGSCGVGHCWPGHTSCISPPVGPASMSDPARSASAWLVPGTPGVKGAPQCKASHTSTQGNVLLPPPLFFFPVPILDVSTAGLPLGPNHLEERLLDQAQARASYTPLFLGHLRSIPQGMILDVQPLVKSLFCPIRSSPMDFLILRPLSPKTGYHFFEGGGWGWGGWRWGGVKSFRSEGSKQWGSLSLSHNHRSNGNAADAKFWVGGSNPGRLIVGGGGGAVFTRPGFEPPTKKTPGSGTGAV